MYIDALVSNTWLKAVRVAIIQPSAETLSSVIAPESWFFNTGEFRHARDPENDPVRHAKNQEWSSARAREPGQPKICEQSQLINESTRYNTCTM